ncbi:MAG: RIP metalloprotease RseP [Candidatus Puniceispirillum sp.]
MPELGLTQLIIGFLLLITPVVFFHELGHYWVARRAGVIVEVFSIGFGPEIVGWTSKQTGTRWRIAAIPLGGYVKMRGDEDAMSTPTAQRNGTKGGFPDAPLFWRFAIVLAGPVANFILGILLFALVYMTVGKQVLPAEIGEVLPQTAAAEAGLQAGDVVIEVDGVSIRDFNDMRGLVIESPGKELSFIIERGGQQIELPVTPMSHYDDGLKMNIGLLGVRSVPSGERVRMLPGSALVAGTSDAFYTSLMILRGLGRVFTADVQSGEIQGPVGIAKISGSALQQGIVPFVLLTAIISINLGLINLLPVPALDGGHLAFFTYEALMGKPLPLAVQAFLMRGGMTILLTLMAFLIFFDFTR